MVSGNKQEISGKNYNRPSALGNDMQTILERAMSLIVENSPHPVIIAYDSGKILYRNNAAGEFLKIGRGEGREEHISDLDFCDDPDPLLKFGKSLMNEESGGSDLIMLRNIGGERRILSLRITTFTDKRVRYCCYHFIDLTDKILSDDALKKSEKDKTLILNSIHENLVYYDREFRIVWANQSPAESLGMEPAEMKGKLCYELWYGRSSPCPDCTVKKVMESGQPLVEEKTRPNGKNVKIASYPVFGEDGEIIGAVESVLDISRRKQAEKALEEKSKQYRDLFKTMTNGFVLHEIMIDESGVPNNFRFLDVNPAFEEMTGLFAVEMIGKTVLELFPDYNRKWIERYGRVALTGNPEEFSDYNEAFGKYYHIYAYSPEKGQFATIFSDISDFVALKKKQSRLMLQINRNFEQLAILNDEIRNPLQVIAGYAAMYESEHSDKIMAQIEAINRQINELDKRWLESGKIREYLMKHHYLY